MNVKLKVLTAGVMFFTGQALVAQEVDPNDKETVLEEVELVAVGYGKQKRSDVTSAISQVKGADMANLNTPSFEAQLAGRASGVQVTQQSGEVGASPRIRIRGVNSISSSTQPLYVVDGMVMYSGNEGIGGVQANALGDIHPNDIESIEILKDGAATAIYGSRAANGVVLITTKKGRGGRFTFNYSNQLSFASPTKYYDLLDAQQFVEIANEKIANRYGLYNYVKEPGVDTNWQKAVLRSTMQQDHHISFGGGMGRGKYYASLGYTEQDGILISNGMKRYSVRLNTDHKVTNKIEVGASLGFTKTYYTGQNNGVNSTSGAIFNMLRQIPNTPIYDGNNPTGYNIYTSGTLSRVGQWTNPLPISGNLPNIVYILDNNINKSNISRFIGSVYANVDFTNWLSYRLQLGADNSITKSHMYYNKVHGDGFARGGVIEDANLSVVRWTIQNIITLNKSFGNHNFNATLVHEFQDDRSEFFVGGGYGLVDDYFGKSGVMTGTYSTQTSRGTIWEDRLDSYIARLNYNFGRKYFLQASIRRDGLSKLPTDGRWGTFPGVSLGWTVSNENFMQSLKPVLSDLKLKASYAEVGNTGISGSYPYMSLYGASRYADNTGLALLQAGNFALSWEKSKKYDYGVELGFLNNRITFVADYFINNQDGLVLDRPTDPVYGVPGNSVSQNIGVIKNKGLELAVNADIINNPDFGWSVGANVTFMSNKVKSLVNGEDILTYSNNVNTGIIREGESLRSLYGYRYYGVNLENGNPMYYKADGSLVQQNISNGKVYVYDAISPNRMDSSLDATGNKTATNNETTLNESDKVVLGNTLPKYYGSFTTNFRWKNFDLSALVRFSGGNKIYNMTRSEMLQMDFVNNSTEILGRWQSKDNPGDGMTPKVSYALTSNINGNQASSRFVEKGGFVKIDNITLGYSLPKDFINNVRFTQFRVYATVQNAFTFTKYSGLDPEMESGGVDYNNIPRQRTFSIGLNVGF